jgi:hypothetical protein
MTSDDISARTGSLRTPPPDAQAASAAAHARTAKDDVFMNFPSVSASLG